MCSARAEGAGRPALLGVFVLLLVWCPQGTSAQVTDEQLLERLETLAPALREAAAAAEAEQAAEAEARRLLAAQEEARTRVSLDTLRVGPLTVRAFEDQAELARDVFERVWSETYASVSGSPALASTHIVFQWRAPLRTVPWPEVEGVTVRDLSLNRVWIPTRSRLETRVRDAIATTLTQDLDLDSPLRAWMTGRPAGTPSGYADSEAAYRQLAVTPSRATHACLDGDLEACAVALGLELETPRLPQLLTLEARQRMVEQGVDAEGHGMDPDADAVRACLEEQDGDACDRALRENVASTGGSPLAGDATTDLFWYAVDVGGAGAWSRLLETVPAPPMDVLERTSGLEGEELIGAWRASVIRSRPDVHAGLGTARWGALFWFLVLAGLAMRSTRWRLA